MVNISSVYLQSQIYESLDSPERLGHWFFLILKQRRYREVLLFFFFFLVFCFVYLNIALGACWFPC